jgi:hypothetical protein
MEAQKTLNSQSNPEQKEQHFRYHNTRLQIILQSHSNKNNMILAQKKTRRWKRIEDLEIKSYNYSHLIFDEGAKDLHLFTKWCWKKW